MSEVEALSMPELVSTKKKKKNNSESTKPVRTVTTFQGFQTREDEPQFAWFIEFFIYASF